jgi:hypothetical protein
VYLTGGRLRIKDLTGSYAGGLLSLAAAGFMAMMIVVVVDHDHSLERVSGEDVAA